jgi:DNA-binding response OmpR family regulator
LRILLVEDELEAQGALTRALERVGYEVHSASETQQALLHLEHRHLGPPDVAVLDVVLGADDRGGLRVLEALRARSADVPVVMVTAFADVEKVKTALNLGASHLLEKPFRAADLLSVINRLMATRPDRAETVRLAFARVGLTPREAERQHLSRVYEKHDVSGRGELVALLLPL